jgi:CMP-N,N'-diacetyllegionaminic acid synthase
MREHPFECVERLENGKLEFLRSAIETGGGRQQYPSNFFFIDGSFYLNSVSFIKEKNTLFDKEETELFVNRQRWSVDIDEIDDIEIAKATYVNVNR